MMQHIIEMAQYIQYSDILGWVLLLVNAVLSALFSEMLVQKVFKDRKLTILKFSVICIVVYGVFTGCTLLLLWGLLHFFPQQESFWVLLKKTGETHAKEFMIPLVTTLIAGWAINSKGERRKLANILLCFLLIVSTVLSSIMFFLNSFQMIQRPKYVAPVESISSIINSRLSLYPFILSGSILESIGDGSELIARPSAETGEYDGPEGEEWEQEEYQEPDDFSSYIYAITVGTYAPGMDMEDYLEKAYALFLNGEHRNDFFNIGLMWNYIYDCLYLFYEDSSITAEKCLDESIAAYQKYEEENGGSAGLYSNMAIIYGEMGDRQSVREYTRKALEFEEESYALSNYLIDIYYWIDDEDYELLMEDAETVLAHENNLSMYILYGACAVAENKHIENAYNLLCEADEYFEGKSAMVKILRCICADLISIDDIPLHEIYELEDKKGLTKQEESYLIRFLFTTNRYEELWGYIADVGTDENVKLDAELAAIKSSWYFRNPDIVYSDVENVKLLLQQVDSELEHVYWEEDRELLLLSQTLLRNYLGETEVSDVEINELESISDLQYVFLATSAFNEARYDNAIDYCEEFFSAEKSPATVSSGDVFSLQQLEPQERMTLHYYMQLVFAHAHFEYAKEFRKGSDEWKSHMEASEKECAVFEQSSKSMFYISEKFRILKDSIDLENGKIPQELDEDEKSEVEVL